MTMELNDIITIIGYVLALSAAFWRMSVKVDKCFYEIEKTKAVLQVEMSDKYVHIQTLEKVESRLTKAIDRLHNSIAELNSHLHDIVAGQAGKSK